MTQPIKIQTSSRRLLILCPTSDTTQPQFTSFLTALTGHAPQKDLRTYAGYTSHPALKLRTKYYAADVSLWCDEIPAVDAEEPSLDSWVEQMISDEAKEVREAIGSIVLLLPRTKVGDDKLIEECVQYIEAVTRLGYQIDDESDREFTTISVLQDVRPTPAADRTRQQNDETTLLDKLQETCISDHGLFGWEFISLPADPHLESKPSQHVTEDGEKVGLARVIEALEQVMWLSSDKSGVDQPEEAEIEDLLSQEDELDSSPVPTSGGPHSVRPLLQTTDDGEREDHDKDEEGDQGLQVEQLSSLMERVTAIREAGGEISKEEREKFAKREIAKIMKELDLK